MENFGWAIIGCGKIAQKAAREIKAVSAGKIVAVWNRTQSRAEKFVKKYGGKAYSSAEEAVTAEGVNCVYVATTHDKHMYYSALSIKLGVPVLCEKPITVNAEEASSLFSLAKERGVYLAEAMWTWHNPISLKVREWVESGRLGDITRVEACFAFPMMYINRNARLTSPDLIGGVLLDLGIYPVRYVYELFGLPQNITCRGRLLNGIDTDDEIVMEYPSFKAEIFVSMRRFRGEKVKIYGTRGKITVPYFHTATSARLKSAKNERFKGVKHPFGLEFLHTAKEVLKGLKNSGYCPEKNTLDTIKLLDECRRQMGVVYPNENKNG